MSDVKRFYQRLGHKGYGLTELAVIDPGKGVIATGFFSSEAEFVKASAKYDGRYNIFAGRNPRPRWLPKLCEDTLDTKHRQRAKDSDIEFITAISLDIDPVRPKGTSSSDQQHKRAIWFALKLHQELGGWVDSSGNGSYFWVPFRTPITVRNRDEIKQKCRLWQTNIAKVYRPEKYGLRIDGCYDLSRVKKVIGTMSVKGRIHRRSRFVTSSKSDNAVRDAILSLTLQPTKTLQIKPGSLPQDFFALLKTNPAIQKLWLTPNEDTSMHDWILGSELVKAGIKADALAKILMLNPFGKYQRDRRYSYIKTTVNKLMGGISGS